MKGGISCALQRPRLHNIRSHANHVCFLCSCNVLIIVIVCCLSLWFRICNRQANQGKRVIEGEATFRYTI